MDDQNPLKRLDAKIDVALIIHLGSEPTDIADGLELDRHERAALLAWALDMRITERVRIRRASHISSARTPAATPAATAEMLGARTRHEERLAQIEAESKARRQQINADMHRYIQDFADARIREGILIGIEQANNDWVYVHGERMLLGDCTADDLRAVADDYASRATSNLNNGSYYLALANQVQEGGYATVRAMCEVHELVTT